MTSHDEMGTNNTSSTYVVRPEKDFASDSNPDYLELHYPDLFPFGRGGFGEQRKNQISRQALVKHLLNLSTRQFHQVDCDCSTHLRHGDPSASIKYGLCAIYTSISIVGSRARY